MSLHTANGPGTGQRRANPATHRCDIPDLDYSQVQEGRIECTACGRVWIREGRHGWEPYPHPRSRRW